MIVTHLVRDIRKMSLSIHIKETGTADIVTIEPLSSEEDLWPFSSTISGHPCPVLLKDLYDYVRQPGREVTLTPRVAEQTIQYLNSL